MYRYRSGNIIRTCKFVQLCNDSMRISSAHLRKYIVKRSNRHSWGSGCLIFFLYNGYIFLMILGSTEILHLWRRPYPTLCCCSAEVMRVWIYILPVRNSVNSDLNIKDFEARNSNECVQCLKKKKTDYNNLRVFGWRRSLGRSRVPGINESRWCPLRSAAVGSSDTLGAPERDSESMSCMHWLSVRMCAACRFRSLSSYACFSSSYACFSSSYACFSSSRACFSSSRACFCVRNSSLSCWIWACPTCFVCMWMYVRLLQLVWQMGPLFLRFSKLCLLHVVANCTIARRTSSTL
jgi:hypothetical protein